MPAGRKEPALLQEERDIDLSGRLLRDPMLRQVEGDYMAEKVTSKMGEGKKK